MDISRGVVPQSPQVDMLQHVESLQQDGGLRPGRLGTDLVAGKGGADGRLESCLIALQIFQPQQPANALGEGGDAVRNLALIKHPTRRLQTGTAVAGSRALCFDQQAQRLPELWLHEQAPYGWHLAARVEDRCPTGRVEGELLQGLRD